MRFAIVDFLDDASVDVVPSNWLINEKYCLWPPYRPARLIIAVRKMEEPDREKWANYTIRVLRFYGMSIVYIV